MTALATMDQNRETDIKIPLLNLRAQYRRIKPEIQRAIDEVLESQRFILGPLVERFEEEVASYLGCASATGVASGSDALLLSLMALGIGPGQGVLVPPLTFFSTVSAITRLGATPIFVDVDPGSCLMDPQEVERVIEGRCGPGAQGLRDRRSGCEIKAVLPVHLYGRSCPMASLISLAQKYRLQIVEDVAQAFGARAELSPGVSRHAGTIGDLGCYSFFPTKTLGGFGDGGLVATHKRELGDKIKILRVHGQTSRYNHQAVGLNSRLDAIQAAVLRVKLRHLDRWCEERIERARRYRELFLASGLVGEGILSLPSLGRDRSHVFNHYIIHAWKRDELKAYLRGHGIETEVYYSTPLHLQPCFSHLGYQRGDFPKAEAVASQVLALPMCPELTSEEQEFVVEKIIDFYRS